MNVKHSGLKSLTVFLKASAREGLIGIGERKGRVAVTGTSCLHVVERWINQRRFDVGVDESCSSVPVQVRHGTLKDVDAHKENRKRGRGGYRTTPCAISDTLAETRPCQRGFP